MRSSRPLRTRARRSGRSPGPSARTRRRIAKRRARARDVVEMIGGAARGIGPACDADGTPTTGIGPLGPGQRHERGAVQVAVQHELGAAPAQHLGERVGVAQRAAARREARPPAGGGSARRGTAPRRRAARACASRRASCSLARPGRSPRTAASAAPCTRPRARARRARARSGYSSPCAGIAREIVGPVLPSPFPRHGDVCIVVAGDRVHAIGRAEAREPVGRLAELLLERDLRQIARDREMVGRGLREVGEQRLQHGRAIAAAPAQMPREPAEHAASSAPPRARERHPGGVQIRDVTERGDGALRERPPA